MLSRFAGQALRPAAALYRFWLMVCEERWRPEWACATSSPPSPNAW